VVQWLRYQFSIFFSASLQQQSFLMARSSDEDAAPWQGGGRVVSSDRNPAVMAGTHSIYNRKGIYPARQISVVIYGISIVIYGYLWWSEHTPGWWKLMGIFLGRKNPPALAMEV
jgi:hypothetical protein